MIIGLIIMCVYFSNVQYEPFENLNIYAMRLFGLAKHVKLNKFNRVDAIYIKPPLPKTGESRCYTVPCPDWVPDNATCYKCN